jgi:hypothetical protein
LQLTAGTKSASSQKFFEPNPASFRFILDASPPKVSIHQADDTESRLTIRPTSNNWNFHGQKRTNETHESTTDPDARLYKKSYGKQSHLAYLGHALVENRNGLIAAAMATQADGYAEREVQLLMLQEKQKGNTQRITVGADKAYDTKDFVTAARALNVTAHVTKNEKGRRSNLDRRTTRHPGYTISLSRRWLVEKDFRWLKQTGPVRQVKLRGLHKVDWIFVFSCAAHNFMWLPRLIAHQALEGLQQQCA